MSEWTLLRIGAVSAFVGAILAIVLLALRPVFTGDIIEEPESTIQKIASSDFWQPWHVIFPLAALLVVGGLATISRSIKIQPAASLGRLAFAAAVAGLAVLAVLIGTDGFGIKIVAEQWADRAADKAEILRIAKALDAVNVGIFGVWIATFFGVTFVLYGLAFSIGGPFLKWMGWVAMVVGLGAHSSGAGHRLR